MNSSSPHLGYLI